MNETLCLIFCMETEEGKGERMGGGRREEDGWKRRKGQAHSGLASDLFLTNTYKQSSPAGVQSRIVSYHVVSKCLCTFKAWCDVRVRVSIACPPLQPGSKGRHQTQGPLFSAEVVWCRLSRPRRGEVFLSDILTSKHVIYDYRLIIPKNVPVIFSS